MSDAVKDFQTTLARRGYPVGRIDGWAGPNTAAAFDRMLTDMGFEIAVRGNRDSITITPTIQRVPVEWTDESLPPWMRLTLAHMGLHEVRDNARLREFLASDGSTLGDPAQFPWCFTGDTEILTEEGWQPLSAVTARRVWQVSEDMRMSLTEFAPVTKAYRGPLNVIKHQGFTLRADPAHRWWGCFGTEGRARVPKPDQFGTLSSMTTQGLRVPAPFSAGPGVGFSDDQLRLLAAVLSDGTLHRRADGSVRDIVFEVSRERKIAALWALGPDHHYRQPKAYGPKTKTPLDVFRFSAPGWLTDAMDPETKELRWSFVSQLGAAEAREFLKSYRVFDGTDRRFHLYTSSPARRDALQAIATLAGWRVGVTVKKSPLSKKPCYELHIRTDETRQFIHPDNVRQEDFNGTLYCVTVPEGRIIVREPGRGAIVTGNCGDLVQTPIRRTLPSEPFPGKVGQNPYLARNWLEFGKECQPGVGAVMVFWRGSRSGIYGHVAFYWGEDDHHYYVLGGNQSNTISVARIARNRFLGARWPVSYEGDCLGPRRFEDPEIALSVNEA